MNSKKRKRQDQRYPDKPEEPEREKFKTDGDNINKGKTTKRKNVDRSESNNSHDDHDDWINNLVIQEKGDLHGAKVSSTKQDRIEKRLAKKKRREERKSTLKVQSNGSNSHKSTVANAKHYRNESQQSKKNPNQFTQNFLVLLSRELDSTVQRVLPDSVRVKPLSFTHNERTRARPTKRRPGFNSSSESSAAIQPRRNDYGGIGLARPSLYLSMQDPAFFARLQEEFEEHIPGFFGKQRTKAMKKQLDKNMLWRQLLQHKQKNTTIKVKSGKVKKIADMTPDERIEALL